VANAVVAPWLGNNYQARVFWLNALSLRAPDSCVAEVTFEASAPRAFDDVVVRYDPPVPGSGATRILADHQQVKWHVVPGKPFGFADLADPGFVGAERVSLLQRLRMAKATAAAGSRFSLVTVSSIATDDQLWDLISHNDSSLMLERLFDGTGRRSRMGRVRACWRDHLLIDSDDELRRVLEGFRICHSQPTLERLREAVNERARSVGLAAFSAKTSDFRYDELIRQLNARGLNGLNRASLDRICQEEGLIVAAAPVQSDFLPVAIRTFLGPASDVHGAAPENTLLLNDLFRQRYLLDGQDWQRDIRPRVEAFLGEAVRRSHRLRLILDAHASIAFLAGAVLHLKSGVDVELVQKGRAGGSRAWRADDGTDGPMLDVEARGVGPAPGLLVGISLTHDVAPQMIHFAEHTGPAHGAVLNFMPRGGPSGQAVGGGTHAAAMADQIAREVRAARGTNPDRLAHIFAACPNALLFFLGQHHQAIGPAVVYEFDFDRRGTKTYQPSFVVD
jgi:hypothetical protein